MTRNSIWTWARKALKNWYGQAAGAALVALICFVSMYGIYMHLSGRLPDGSAIFEKSGFYVKRNWDRGAPTSTIGGEASYCMVSAFTQGRCGFEGSGKTVTISVTKFPNVWRDVDVVLAAVSGEEVLSSIGLDGRVSMWKEQSVFDSFFYSFWAFVFAFLGLRGLHKKKSKENYQ